MNETESSNDHKPLQILSLDGGGIKGIFSAALLAAIEEDLGSSVIDHFDLIAGTSTGGIIALVDCLLVTASRRMTSYELYPQPVRRQPTVEYRPERRRIEDLSDR